MNFTKWYVIHNSGTGIRLKKKPTGFEVHGAAGSTSNMIRAREWSYEKDKIDNIWCIRFTIAWAKHNQEMLDRHFTLKEWKKHQIEISKNPNQTTIQEWF